VVTAKLGGKRGFPKFFCGWTFCALRACFVPQKRVNLVFKASFVVKGQLVFQ